MRTVDDPADEGASTPLATAIGGGQQRRTGRGQPAHRLGVEHHRQDHPRYREADDGDPDIGQAEVAIGEDRQGINGSPELDRLPVDEDAEHRDTAGDHRPDPPRPTHRLPLLQTEHDEEQARPGEDHTDDVEAVPVGRQRWEQSQRQHHADDPDRHVDEEDPGPTEVVDENPAGHRAGQRGHPAVAPHRLSATPRRSGGRSG